jgi:DnaJ-class molecular chaperone
MSCIYCKDEPCTCETDTECFDCNGEGTFIDGGGLRQRCDTCAGLGCISYNDEEDNTHN